ncbi:MAG: thioredoxin TrxC [Syntrophales bacterium]|nr:thioredoxin TrxC [Syntrophales bacterium]
MEKDEIIIRCLSCGTKNRIPQLHMNDRPTCGRCHAPLDEMIIRCLQCGTKNRMPENRLNEKPLCGKCGEPLVVSEKMGVPVDVTDETFAQEVIQASGVVLVDCWAPWCGPCRMVAPVLDDLAAKYPGSLRVAKLNVDNNPVISSQYDVRSIPTMLLFKDGKVVERLVGALAREEIERQLLAVMPSS